MKSKRRKTLIMILFPGIILLWIIGWGLYWIGGNQKKPVRTDKQNHKEEPFEIQVAFNLQEEEIPQ